MGGGVTVGGGVDGGDAGGGRSKVGWWLYEVVLVVDARGERGARRTHGGE